MVLLNQLFFNRPELFAWLQEREENFFDLVVQVSENEWQGRSSN